MAKLPPELYEQILIEKQIVEMNLRENINDEIYVFATDFGPTIQLTVGIRADPNDQKRALDFGPMYMGNQPVYLNPTIEELDKCGKHVLQLIQGTKYKISKRYCYGVNSGLGVYYLKPDWQYYYALVHSNDVSGCSSDVLVQSSDVLAQSS